MHKSQYKWDVTIKLTITKRTISRKKRVVETINKSTKRETKLEKERERERESIDSFFSFLFFFFLFLVMKNLVGIGERGGNEVRINLYEN